MLSTWKADRHDGYLGVRQLQKALGESEFFENFKGGGVDRIAAEIAEEVSVLFEDEHFNASARK